MNYEIQLEDFRLAIVALWKERLLIALITFAGFLVGLLFTSLTTTSEYYGATASVYSATYGSYQLTQTDVNIMVNYSDVLSSRKVSEYAASLIKDTGITADEIQNIIGISFSDNSYVMEISAVNRNPEVVIKVVNAVAEAFVSEVSRVTGNEAIQILDRANRAFIYRVNDLNRTRLYFAIGAFIISCSIIGLRSLFSNRVQSIAQCTTEGEEILGIIPKID